MEPTFGAASGYRISHGPCVDEFRSVVTGANDPRAQFCARAGAVLVAAYL